MTLHIGFTGTRHGMTFEQRLGIETLVREMTATTMGARIAWHAHHGDCVGADSEFHDIALAHGGSVIVHPGPIGENSAGRRGADRLQPLSHFARNRVIVNESTVMFATPHEATHQTRGGTWYTIDYANKVGKPLVLVLPDGSVSPNAEYMAWFRGSIPA